MAFTITKPNRDVYNCSSCKHLNRLFRKNAVSFRNFFILWLIVAFSIHPLLGQEEESNSRIDRLTGGDIGLNFKWSGEAFSNLGSRADAMGGSISTLFPGAESISSNPAGLGFAHDFQVTLDWSPPLAINPDGLLGIQSKVNDALITAAENNNPPIDSVSGKPAPERVVEDARVSSHLDMRGGLKGGALMYGNPIFAVGASFHQPFRVESQLNMSGMEFLAAALDDEGRETHRLFGTINGNVNMNFTVESTNFGAGTRLLPNLSLGVVYEHFNGDIDFEGTFLPEGIIASTGGETRSFNDPTRVQYDSLYAIMRGNWEGNGFRFRSGVGYHPIRNISLDAVVVTPATIDLRGPSSVIYNSIRALNLDASGDEEVLDVDVLVEDNLTKTEKNIVRTQGVDIEMPGSVALGFSAKWDNYLASVVYTKYFEQLGYTFRYEKVDSLGMKKDGGRIHQGVDFGQALRLGIGVEQLILGLGFLTAKTFREEIQDDEIEPDISEPSNFFVPFFSLGGGVRINSSIRLDYVLSLYNSAFFRFSTTFLL